MSKIEDVAEKTDDAHDLPGKLAAHIRLAAVSSDLDLNNKLVAASVRRRASSRRPAVLLPPVVAAMKAHRKRQAAERLAAVPAWREHGHVFPTCVGTPERGDNVLKRSLKPLAADIGDPTLTPAWRR